MAGKGAPAVTGGGKRFELTPHSTLNRFAETARVTNRAAGGAGGYTGAAGQIAIAKASGGETPHSKRSHVAPPRSLPRRYQQHVAVADAVPPKQGMVDDAMPNLKLLRVAKEGNLKAVREALADGADVNYKDEKGRTCIHWAAVYRQFDTLSILLNIECALIREPDIHGYEPVHCAAIRGARVTQEEADTHRVLVLFADFSVPLTTRTAMGDTPLILASRWGLMRIVTYLLSLPSVFVDARYTRGVADMTAQEIAAAWGYVDVAAYIEERCAVARVEI